MAQFKISTGRKIQNPDSFADVDPFSKYDEVKVQTYSIHQHIMCLLIGQVELVDANESNRRKNCLLTYLN